MTGMTLKTLSKMSQEWPSSEKMPALFVGHGNPMNAILENDITQGWRKMTEGLQPRAILCISAHWQTRGTLVTMSKKPKTIHDFYGFPQALFDIEYPAPGAPDVASELISSVKGLTVEEDHDWGLDHGTWSVLIKMFPKADVPVFQLSLDHRMSPKAHYELATELSILRNKGVLIVGSGNIIHNLGKANWHSDTPYDWAIAFDQTTKDLISEGRHDELMDYNKFGTNAKLSIPTNEHYLPMLYTLGVQHKSDEIRFFNETIEMGSISMRSFVVG